MGGIRGGRDRAEEAFAGFLERHWPEAVRFFRQGLHHDRDRPNAEDCAQEAFIKLARRYRDDTATVRATERPATMQELARRLGCDLVEARARAERAVVSGWLRIDDKTIEPTMSLAMVPTAEPLVLDLAPLAAMRWTTYRNVLTDYTRRRLATENRRTGDLDQLLTTSAEPRDRLPGPEGATIAAALHAQLTACLDQLAGTERAILILHYFYGLRFPALATIPELRGAIERRSGALPQTESQLVQRLKDLAKLGRRQLRRRCPHLADFLATGGEDAS